MSDIVFLVFDATACLFVVLVLEYGPRIFQK